MGIMRKMKGTDRKDSAKGTVREKEKEGKK
jgi:hypothetical protein